MNEYATLLPKVMVVSVDMEEGMLVVTVEIVIGVRKKVTVIKEVVVLVLRDDDAELALIEELEKVVVRLFHVQSI